MTHLAPDQDRATVELWSAVGRAALASAPARAAAEVRERLADDATAALDGAKPSLPETSASTCNACGGLAFADATEQREHFRSDAHRLNVKRASRGKAPLSPEEAELELERLAEGGARDGDELGSLSGSASEESEEDPGDGDGDVDADEKRRGTPILSVRTSQANVAACLFEQVARSREEVEELARTPQHVWAVMLYQAGHFAAAVFRNGKLEKHTTSHRYVTRRKQGGSQSAHDNKGHKAKSAGAMLRRYGEQTLNEAVANVMRTWDLKPCTRVFLAVPQKARPLFVAQTANAGDGRLYKGDPRLRRVPFMTRRPTLSEAERVCRVLGTVRLERVPDVVPPAPAHAHAHAEAPTHPPVAATPTPTPTPPPPSAEELALAERARNRELGFFDREIHAAARANDVARVRALVADDRAALEHRTESGDTALHEACKANAVETVSALLELGADPSADDFRGRVPYLATSSKAVRNALREFRGAHPDRWDWTKANVPEPAVPETPEQREARLERERVKRKEKKDRQKAEEDAERARAAEVEAKNACHECGKRMPAADKDRFFQGTGVFCSAACMRAKARKLAADAFDRRARGEA